MEESPFELTFEESSRKSCYEFKKRKKKKISLGKEKGKGGKKKRKKADRSNNLIRKTMSHVLIRIGEDLESGLANVPENLPC